MSTLTPRTGSFWPNHEWLAGGLLRGVQRRWSAGADTVQPRSRSSAAGSSPGVSPLDPSANVSCGCSWRSSHRVSGGSRGRMPSHFCSFRSRWRCSSGDVSGGCRWCLSSGRIALLLGFVLLGAGLGVQTLLAPRTWPQAALVFFACMLAATATPLGLSFWFEIPKSLARISSLSARRVAPAAPDGPSDPVVLDRCGRVLLWARSQSSPAASVNPRPGNVIRLRPRPAADVVVRCQARRTVLDGRGPGADVAHQDSTADRRHHAASSVRF